MRFADPRYCLLRVLVASTSGDLYTASFAQIQDYHSTVTRRRSIPMTLPCGSPITIHQGLACTSSGSKRSSDLPIVLRFPMLWIQGIDCSVFTTTTESASCSSSMKTRTTYGIRRIRGKTGVDGTAIATCGKRDSMHCVSNSQRYPILCFQSNYRILG